LPPGTSVDLTVLRNGAAVEQSSVVVDDLVWVREVDASASSTSPGDEYRVEVNADGLTLTSEVCTVIAGAPASVTLSTNASPLVGDGATQRAFTATVRDANGNFVRDSTGVWFQTKNRLGGGADSLFATTVSGEATVSLTAPIAGSLTAWAHAAPATSDSLTVETTPLDGNTLTANSDTLDVALGETATLTLSTSTSAGAPAAEGAVVYWSVSNDAGGVYRTETTTVGPDGTS